MYKMHEERYKQSFCKYQLSTEFQSLFWGGLNINPFNYGIIGYNNVKVTCRKLPGFIMSITYSMDMFSSYNLWEHRVCIGLKRYARERF